jgi:DNA (cytosine-5)-methyltransferase 1
MGDILRDLAEIGYDAEWDCIPAAAVGALHYRDRLWIIAYPHSNGERRERIRLPQTRTWSREQFERLVHEQILLSIPTGRRGLLSDGVPGRMGQLRGYGNSVVPKIAEIIGRAIMNACSTPPKSVESK